MKILKSFLAGLFSIFFGIFVVATICIFCISGFASKSNVKEKLKETDLLMEVKKIRNSGNTESESKITAAINDVYSLASQFSVSEEVVDKIIDSKATKEVIGSAVGNLTDYVINGKEAKILSSDDVYEVISDNLDDVLKASDLKIDDSSKEKFLREIKKQLPDIVEVIPNSEDVLGTDYGDKVEIMQKIFSTQSKVICVLGIIVSMIVVILLKKKEFEWLANLGVSLLMSGLATIGISLLMPSVIVSAMNEADLSLFASSLTGFITKPILYCGIGLIIISLGMFIGYKILEKRNLQVS